MEGSGDRFGVGWDLGVEGYIDVKGGRNTPSRGLRFRVFRFKEEHPEVWREKYQGPRAFHESSYHALKAVTGEFLPGRTRSMQDRYRALKYFACDLYLLAKDHMEEVLSSFWRRISTDPRSRSLLKPP